MANRVSDVSYDFPILIGDIGGTNARFALVVDAYAEPKIFPVVQTSDYETIDDAIQAAVLDKTSLQPKSMVLAVAGPVDGDEVDLTNCPWVVKPHVLISKFGLTDVIVLNDFEAQALAVVALGREHLHKLGGNEPDPTGGRVVLGPGTGLGVAGLVHANRTWVPVPGEGGHMDVGPRTNRDFEIFPHLEAIDGRISGEQLLCGRGLVNIYRAVCAANGSTPGFDDPAQITAAALDKSDAAAIETLELFIVYLGRVAGDLALVFMAKGGVYLAGGIVQKILPAISAASLRGNFEDKAPHQAMMKEIPIFVVTHPLAALAGLADYARTPTRFGVSLEGRRWPNA
jgi:glucokinase